MITVTNPNRTLTWEIYGKSSDAKPTEDVPNASVFYEMDTKKIFMFDEDSKTWLEQ